MLCRVVILILKKVTISVVLSSYTELQDLRHSQWFDQIIMIQYYPLIAVFWNILYRRITKPELRQFQYVPLREDHSFNFISIEVNRPPCCPSSYLLEVMLHDQALLVTEETNRSSILRDFWVFPWLGNCDHFRFLPANWKVLQPHCAVANSN